MRIARWRCLPLAVVMLAGLAWTPAASADNSQSTNWAGYAIHHSGVKFDKVLGSWTQPQPTCTAGQPTYSSIWVGIGGYSLSSQALEQIGTEDDCTAAGRASSSAWYELVPSPSRNVKLKVTPGDRMTAEVSITGHDVTMILRDLTSHRSFTRTVRDATLDTGSAEWIVEAPSVCRDQYNCHTLPLADFTSAAFTAASARTTTGHAGAIADRRWTTTRITLSDAGQRFVSAGPGTPGTAAGADATPSVLADGGSAFTVTYTGSSTGVTTDEVKLSAGERLVHAAPLR